MSTPAVSAVRKAFPQARLSVLAKPVYEDFWQSFPGVDQVFLLQKGLAGYSRTVLELRQQHFDTALVLPTSFSSAFLCFAAEIPERIGWGGEGRDLFLTHVVPNPQARKKHLVLEYLELVQKGFRLPVLKEKAVSLQCPLPNEAKTDLKKIWAEMGIRDKAGFIALSPGATYGPAKRWPLPYWKELLQRLLKERKESFLILGGWEEEPYLRPLVEGFSDKDADRLRLLAGRTTPTILGTMLSRCKLLVTNDTGPMHVAAGVGTPVVALFGSTSPPWTRPFGKGHEVIYKHVDCSPCFQRTCPIGYLCLNRISVSEVYQAVQKQLKTGRRVQAEIVKNLRSF